MTFLPVESRDFEGLRGDNYPDYRVGPVCSVPNCAKLCDHAHHVVRRSALAGDYKWVRMPDKVEIGNIVGLCFAHHQEITENKQRISYREGKYFWTDGKPLTQQPPVREPIPAPTEDGSSESNNLNGSPSDVSTEIIADVEPIEEHDPKTCPTCKRPMPRPKIDTPKEDRKPRGTWAVAVPMDVREDGADTLDELLEASRDEMAKKGWEYGDSSTAKFFVLSHALSMFVLNAGQILGDE